MEIICLSILIIRRDIDGSGNLGIGNDASFPIFTDDRSLILGAGSGSVGLQLYSSTTGYGGIYFGDANSGAARYRGYIEYNHGSDFLRFATGAAEHVRITSSGRLGVGTINPAIKLHVVDSASTPIRLQNTGGGSVYTQYVNNDNARGYVGYEGKRLAFYADNGSNTGDTRVAFMDADGLKFFNDTAQANALDDYEEGTFTPSFNGTITYTGSLTGNYTKIGKVVYFSIGLSNQTFTNATGGVAKITGLPFTAASDSIYRTAFYIGYNDTTTNASQGGYVEDGTTNLIFYDAGTRNTSTFSNGTAKFLYLSGFMNT